MSARSSPFVWADIIGKTAMNTRQKLISGMFVLGLGFGCAGQQGDDKAKTSDPVVVRQKVGNISAVDLTICFPKAPTLPEKINATALTGLLVSSRPLVMECLVDPKNRGPADDTSFTLESTLGGGKLTHKFSATNLTAAGEQCIGAAVDRFVASAPDWAARASAVQAPVTAKAPFQHSAASMPAVKFGTSEASDAAGTIRLAQATFCDCLTAWKEAEPVPLKASIKLKKGTGATVTFDASTDATATQIAACLQPKVSALPLKTTSDELTAPYTFAFANSTGFGLFTNATPDMAFMQYDSVRNQYFGAMVVADGGRSAAADVYETFANQYRKDPKSVTILQLQTSCEAMLVAQDAYIAALEKQLGVEEKGLSMLTELAAKDSSWAPVKDGTVEHVARTKKDIASAKDARTADGAMCAKLKI